MNKKDPSVFLITTADDFGCSLNINRAVEEAASKGILKTASLMINGREVADAIDTARRIPSLQVGLHVTLTQGRPLSSEDAIPSLLDNKGCFKNSPTRLGLAIQFNKSVENQARTEIALQFKKFSETGLPFSHVDCHHHFHIHPKVFDIIMENALMYKLGSIRIPYEPWDISGPLCRSNSIRNWFYRRIFSKLCAACKDKIRNTNLSASDGVFGLYQTGRITEDWVSMLLERLEGRHGTYELYTHPDIDPLSKGWLELKALTSPRIQTRIEEKKITLLRFEDMVVTKVGQDVSIT